MAHTGCWVLCLSAVLLHQTVAEQLLRVVTIHDPPYVRVEKDASGKVTKFEGFVADLLTYATNKLGYTTNVTVVDKYGARDPQSGAWTGMMGELYNNRADIAAAALTKNVDRQGTADFTLHFLTTRLQLLKSTNLPTIVSIKQLAEVTSVPYGAIRDGNTWTLLKTSKGDQAITTVGNKLTAVNSTWAGVSMVRNNSFIMVMEGLTADYWVSQYPCELATTSGELFDVDYAFAVQVSKSEVTAKFNDILGKPETLAKIEELKAKYWVKRGCGSSAARLPLAGLSHVLGLVATWLAVRFVGVL